MLDMILIPKSRNEKTGNIIQSYSSRKTCPNRCPFKLNGCYGDNLHVSMNWARCDDPQDSRYIGKKEDLTKSLVSAVSSYKGDSKVILFRHNVAGDIAKENTSKLDWGRICDLYQGIHSANEVTKDKAKVLGYTYTHCKIYKKDVKYIVGIEEELLINASCETIEEVMYNLSLHVPTVIASANPEETKKELKELGIKSYQCPAQTHDNINCDNCRLCAKHRNGTVIIFGLHGTGKAKARKAIMLKKL